MKLNFLPILQRDPGCTNPAAVNYDPSADEDDLSCIYLTKVDGVCYAFNDVDPNTIKDQSFTMSWAMEGQNWVFFHDYVPDFYFHTREKLHLLKNNKIFTANAGNTMDYREMAKPGTPKFFIDVVFSFQDQEVLLNSINWISEFVQNTPNITGEQQPDNQTLSHITVWNGHQCTGRIPISKLVTFDPSQGQTRRTEAKWFFNDFRDKLLQRGEAFLGDLFSDFAVDETKLGDRPWFEESHLEDNYFVVRFEWEKSGEYTVFLHDVNVDVDKSAR